MMRSARGRERDRGERERYGGDLRTRAREDSRGNRDPVVRIARGRLHGGHRAASSRVADEAPRVPSRLLRVIISFFSRCQQTPSTEKRQCGARRARGDGGLGLGRSGGAHRGRARGSAGLHAEHLQGCPRAAQGRPRAVQLPRLHRARRRVREGRRARVPPSDVREPAVRAVVRGAAPRRERVLGRSEPSGGGRRTP